MADENRNLRITKPLLISKVAYFDKITLTDRNVRTILKNLEKDGAIEITNIDNGAIRERHLLIHIRNRDEWLEYDSKNNSKSDSINPAVCKGLEEVSDSKSDSMSDHLNNKIDNNIIDNSINVKAQISERDSRIQELSFYIKFYNWTVKEHCLEESLTLTSSEIPSAELIEAYERRRAEGYRYYHFINAISTIVVYDSFLGQFQDVYNNLLSIIGNEQFVKAINGDFDINSNVTEESNKLTRQACATLEDKNLLHLQEEIRGHNSLPF